MRPSPLIERSDSVMSQLAAPLMPPSRKESDEAGIEATAIHVAEILEDLRVAERVERSLRATGHMPLRVVQVSVCGRVVILQGQVPSYQPKASCSSRRHGCPGH